MLIIRVAALKMKIRDVKPAQRHVRLVSVNRSPVPTNFAVADAVAICLIPGTVVRPQY